MKRNFITHFAAIAPLTLAVASCMLAQEADRKATAPADDRDDPNLPGLASPAGLEIQWSQYTRGYPQILLVSPRLEVSNSPAHYMGWNDQGSWIRSEDGGRVYIWNFAKKTLTKAFDSEAQIPQETLATLHNFKDKKLLANYKPAPPAPRPAGPKPDTPDTSRQAAFFGGAGNAAQPFPGAITGSGAAIQDGVLTFTRADNTKASYKVVRPKVAQGAAGNTGTWIARQDEAKGILFTVQGDGTLTGREMPAQFIQMLMQGTAPQMR